MTAHTGRSDTIGDDAHATSAVGIDALADRIAAIAKSIEDRSALDAQLTQAIAELIDLREVRAESSTLRLAMGENEERLEQMQMALQAAEATVRDLSQNLASVVDERDEEVEKRKSVTKKYRRAAMNADHARQEQSSLERRLAAAQTELTSIKGALSYRLLSGIRANPIATLKGRLSRKAMLSQQVDSVRQSAFFDADWYLETYPDVAAANIDPALHYVEEGWREGRNPGPEFSSNGYLKANRDVAAASLNPLIHYLEHGLAEGRSAGDLGAAIPRRTNQDFGPPAPVFAQPIEAMAAVRWTRHYDLEGGPGTVLRIGEHIVGYAPDGGVAVFDEPLARFWRISNMAGDCPTLTSGDAAAGSAQPIWADGWLVGNRMLRTRWALGGGMPIVVRGYQRDGRNRTPGLVGEALVTSALDVADFTLANPLFPILFVLCRPDGEVIGASHLGFPSLCRGGLHYAELLAEQGGGDVSAISLGDRYAKSLEAIVTDQAVARLKSVRVDLSGADGTRPMFGGHLQDWLDLIMRVDIGEAVVPACADRAVMRFLGDRVAGSPERHSVRTAAATHLTLPSDAIPTIAMLVSVVAGDEETAHEAYGSLLITEADPAKPMLVVDLPPAATLPIARQSGAFPLAFPRLGGGYAIPPRLYAAIRSVGDRAMAESEVLQPIAQPLELLAPPASGRALVVAIEPQLWTLPALDAGIRALALQRGSSAAQLVLIGAIDAERMAIAKAGFGERTKLRPDVHAFVHGLGDEDVLHLGPDIILHDDRTMATFQSLLDGDAASASCPIVRCTRRGKGWAVTVDDSGQALAATDEAPAIGLAPYFAAFSRSVFPVHAQPRNLWAARADVLRNAPEPAPGAHLCCELLTASYFSDVRDQSPTLDLPVARTGTALRVGVLMG